MAKFRYEWMLQILECSQIFSLLNTVESKANLFGQIASMLDSDGFGAKPSMQASIKAEDKSPKKSMYSCAFLLLGFNLAGS